MKPPQPKPPAEVEAPMSSLTGAFLLAAIAAMKPLLRPSARHDMARFVATITSEGKATEFLSWATRVLEAHRQDGKGVRGGRAARVIRETSLPVFRRPDRAYRPRAIF